MMGKVKELFLLVTLFQSIVSWPFSANESPKLNPVPIENSYEPKIMNIHSARSPFYLVRGAVPYWHYGGSAVVSDDVIRLTPNLQSKTGWFWNQKQVTVDEWEVEMKVKIWGNSGLGADGMAFWYTSESYAGTEGPTFGGPATWNGLAVVFDTFDNDNSGDNPKISIFYNDRTWSYDPATEGKTHELGSCRSYYRNQETFLKIQYFEGNIQVWVKTSNRADYEFCSRVKVRLPPNGFLGVTAATGGVSDNHDLSNFNFFQLSPLNSGSPVTPEGNLDRMKGAPREQQVEPPKFEPPKVEPAPQVVNTPPQQEQQQQQRAPNQDRVDSIAQKLKDLKSELNTPKDPTPPPPPFQQQEQQQQQRNSPPTDSSDEIRLIHETQNSLRESISVLKSSVENFSNRISEQSQMLQQISQTQSQIADILNKMVENGGMGGSTQDSQVIEQIRKMENILNNQLAPASNSQTRQLDSLSRSVNELKIKVEETKNNQRNMQNNMERNQQAITNTLEESSSSFGFWTYFILFQFMFGVSFMWFRKYQADKEKKLF